MLAMEEVDAMKDGEEQNEGVEQRKFQRENAKKKGRFPVLRSATMIAEGIQKVQSEIAAVTPTHRFMLDVQLKAPDFLQYFQQISRMYDEAVMGMWDSNANNETLFMKPNNKRLLYFAEGNARGADARPGPLQQAMIEVQTFADEKTTERIAETWEQYREGTVEQKAGLPISVMCILWAIMKTKKKMSVLPWSGDMKFADHWRCTELFLYYVALYQFNVYKAMPSDKAQCFIAPNWQSALLAIWSTSTPKDEQHAITGGQPWIPFYPGPMWNLVRVASTATKRPR